MNATSPVRFSVTVAADQRHAFEVFTERIGDWWPAESHSIEEDHATRAAMDCREGGRIFELHEDGSQADWGVISVWEPPGRLVFSWNPSYEARPATEIEVVFVEISSSETRVDLEHRHWERLGDRGPELRRDYDEGWLPVLHRYSECVGLPL